MLATWTNRGWEEDKGEGNFHEERAPEDPVSSQKGGSEDARVRMEVLSVNRMHSACLMVQPKKEEKAECKSSELGLIHTLTEGFPGGSVVNNVPANAGDTRDVGSFPGSRRSPGEGNGNPLQYSCLENPMGRGAWRAAVLGVTKSRT